MTSTTLTREIAAEETLGRTLGQFVGSWVALRAHEVVADARTLNALLDKIEGTPVDGVLRISSGHYFLNESPPAQSRRVPATEPGSRTASHQIIAAQTARFAPRRSTSRTIDSLWRSWSLQLQTD